MWPVGQPAASLCSPLPVNPCSSVSGSKIFTFPPPDFALSAARRLSLFAPRYPQTLAAPFWGAKSSHSRRRISTSLPPGGAPSLLPAPREPLQLRSGEQILHINPAPTPESGRLFQGAVCSTLLASPCSSVSGSKFFTQIPRRKPVPGGPEHAPPRAGAQKAPCRFIGKVLPSLQQFPAGPSPAGNF